MRPGVRELIDQIRGRPMRKPDLQRVVRGVAARVRHILGTEGGNGPRIPDIGGGVNKIIHTIDHRRNRRVEIVERQQVNAARPLIADREQVVPGKVTLDAQRVFQRVGSGVRPIIRPGCLAI